MRIKTSQVLKYALLPGIRPRIGALIYSGFQYIPFFIALVYQTLRLLPAGHPYANPAYIGRFGMRHVIAEAASNIVLDKRNIDQILLFVLILMGMALIVLQVVLLGMSVIFQPVMAAMPTTFAEFFVTQKPQQDIAHIMLDMVFGVPDFFKSCIDPAAGVACVDIHGKTEGVWNLQDLQWPWPAHQALQGMFTLYSIGLLVIGAMITFYFIVTVLMETAQSGTAFGKRFNKVWAPIRLVVAFGLLVPIGVGFNSSQYIVLYAAKFGSAFATNGWNLFNSELQSNTLLNEQNLVSRPNVPEVGGLLQFFYAARTCAELAQINPSEKYKKKRDELGGDPVQPYFVKDSLASTSAIPYGSYEEMMDFVDGDKQATLRFGWPDGEAGPSKGKIDPICGEIIIPFTDMRKPGEAEKGAEVMQRYYHNLVGELWYDVFTGNPPRADIQDILGPFAVNYPQNIAHFYTNYDRWPDAVMPDPTYRDALQKFYDNDLKAAINNPPSAGLEGIVDSDIGAVKEMIQSPSWDMQPELYDKGWAAAGIWYNRIADMNGAVTAAVLSVPTPMKYPAMMEDVKKQKRRQDQNTSTNTQFEPTLANGKALAPSKYGEMQDAEAMWQAAKYWQDAQTTSTHTTESGNVFVDTVNAAFGTNGLYSMRKNPDVHPLAQLVGIGRSLMDASIRNIGAGSLAAVGSILWNLLSKEPMPLVPAITSFVVSITMIMMTIGFVLYYVLPFLPFIYFFFAVGGWVKAIFEAMIGMPLWALAHIRIDDNGLPGSAAKNGYYLLFEIFLRPILIVFGLLASISIFSALVMTLNQTWDLVVSNAGGFDVESELNGTGVSKLKYLRSSVDEFFYTVIYAIIVYMMGMSSFKLIDQIPTNILRWMGAQVSTFNDSREDAAESLMGTASLGSQQVFSSLGGKLGQGIETMSKVK